MHPHESCKDPVIRLYGPRSHINPIDGYQCSNELRAQLNLTNDQKERRTTPEKHVLLPVKSCENGCGVAVS